VFCSGNISEGVDGRRHPLFCAVYLRMSSFIYLDYNATTPVLPEVLNAMLPFFSQEFGNASSRTHRYGWYAAEAVEKAREQVAALIGCETQEIYFTSGATESINLALKGLARAYASKGKHFITAATEHKAVLDVLEELRESGAEITILKVNREGSIDLDELRSSLRADTIAVALMMANNETGTVHDMEQVSEIVHASNSILFSDTTQAIGKMRVNVNESGIDVCCLSAHKFGGPKGVGALFVRRKNPRVSLAPLIHGGGHERGLRSGTLNVPGIVGLGMAAEIAQSTMWENNSRISAWRTKLEQFITDDDRGFVNGDIKNRLPNTSSILLRDVRAEQLIRKLPNIGISTGSACTASSDDPSHVLQAMGFTDAESRSSVRISLGATTTEEETLAARQAIRDAIDELRATAQYAVH
jgi:cysteine desulfurase